MRIRTSTRSIAVLIALVGLVLVVSPAQALVKPALTVTPTSTSVLHLAWTDSDNETGYRVRVSDTGASGTFATLIELGANVLAHDHTGLEPETTRFYRIVAFNGGGSINSDIESGTTLPDEPPPPPCTGVAVAAPASIQAAIDANPTGTAFCLSGNFVISSSIKPKDGQTFTGPADITGTGHTGFELKGTESGANVNADNVTLDNLTIHGFDLRGVECWAGTVLKNSELYDNERNGVGCGLDYAGPVTIQNNFIHDNGSEAELGRGGGGMKFARCSNCLIEGNQVIDSIGNGIWCDVDCDTFTVRGNTVDGSTRKGIHFEISFGPLLVENNTVTDNNCSPEHWTSATCTPQNAGSPGGGITTNSACPNFGPGCIIRNNILGGNMVAGINFRDDGRTGGFGDPGHGYDVPFEILATGNTMNGDTLNKCNLAGITCSGNT